MIFIGKKGFLRATILMAVVCAVAFAFYFSFKDRNVEKVSYSYFTEVLGESNPANVELSVNNIAKRGKYEFRLKKFDDYYLDNRSEDGLLIFETKVRAYARKEIIEKAKKLGVTLVVATDSYDQYFYFLLFLVFYFMFLFFKSRQKIMDAAGMGQSDHKDNRYNSSGAREFDDDSEDKVTFDDVAGIDEAKEELAETIDFLKNPEKFTRLGARIPKGVLFTGSPGTGKTLLARAVAGEACVPFFSISGSDFVEKYVGVGAFRVRELFATGKKNAPCIIFIDEIDAVGRHRGAGLGNSHDEREQTLNALLVEMDGFGTDKTVIVMAATNRPDILDTALLRPGRFDRQVVVPLPDVGGRKKILEVHSRNKPFSDDVDLHILAKSTPGFSGADLENLLNESAIYAAKKDKEKIENSDLEYAKDKVYMGLERKSKITREEDRKTIAYHEAGHALVARFLPHTDKVNKITIIPRGRAAGVTWFLPEEMDFKYKKRAESELSVLFGGRIAEEIILDDISSGAMNDIKRATDIAQQMVKAWGMSRELGLVSYSKGGEQVFLGREIAQHRDYSEKTAQKIDNEINRLIDGAYRDARKVLEENRDILHKIAGLLLEKETVMGDELDKLIRSIKPGFEFPE